MKLADVKQDPARIEQGAWVGEKYDTPIPEMGDLCVKVCGAENARWRQRQQDLIWALPRNKRPGGKIAADDMDRIQSICLLETGLLDWEGILDDNDQPVPYSKEQAKEILTNPVHRRIRDGIFWAATIVGEVVTAKKAELAKN